MPEPRSLPPHPDLRGLREEARRRQDSGEFSTTPAALVAIAREFGFVSWPPLKFAVEARTQPNIERASTLLRSGTSDDLRRARALLDADPALARYNLACACLCGEIAHVEELLARDPAAASDPTGPFGWEPLLYACFSRLLRAMADRAPGIRAVAAALLAAGASPNAAFVHDERWLQVALYGAAGINGDPELTRMLLEAGAEPTDEREGLHGNEVLYHACEFQDPTCARLVIDAGARQELIDYDLGRALNFPNHAMVAMFCAHGAQPSAANLHQAVWRRRPAETVAALLDARAPVNGRDDTGLTALVLAERWGDADLVALLTQRGADPSTVTGTDRALGAYLSGAHTAAPTDVDLTLLDQMVMQSIGRGDLAAMSKLLDAGARLDGDPDSEEIPLAHACWRGRVDQAEELVRRGAALAFRDGGSAIGALLHGSAHCNHPEGGPTMQTREKIPHAPYAAIATLLLAAGAPIPEREGDGPVPELALAELGVDTVSNR